MTTLITRRSAVRKACGIALGGAVAASGAFAAKDAFAQPATGTGLPVAGTVTDTGAIFEGVLSGLQATLDRANDVINLVGTITGNAGEEPVDETFTTTIDNLAGDPAACDILYLDLGPLHLDVLGLTIDLNEIVLDVNAVPGAGNLLGNLLCAVTGLLDNPGNGVLNSITNLLNRIFSILG